MHAHAEPQSRTHCTAGHAGIFGRVFQRFRLRELRIDVYVLAHHSEPRIFVHGFFELCGQRYVFKVEVGEFQSQLVETFFERLLYLFAQLHEVGGHIHYGNSAFAHRVRNRHDQHAANMIGNILRAIGGMGAGKLSHKYVSVLDAERISSVTADAHCSEIGIAEHDRICRTPTLFGETVCIYEIDFRFEGSLETVFPR